MYDDVLGAGGCDERNGARTKERTNKEQRRKRRVYMHSKTREMRIVVRRKSKLWAWTMGWDGVWYTSRCVCVLSVVGGRQARRRLAIGKGMIYVQLNEKL